MTSKIFCFLCVFSLITSNAQDIQQQIKNEKVYHKKEHLSFNYKPLIIPAVLISYGVIGIKSETVKSYNLEIQNKIQKYAHNKIKVDDYAQYAPALSVYALNLLGVEGKHNLKERTVILGTALIFVGAMVNGLKYSTGVERPDGSAQNSFPSGHTTMVFAGAEFLWQEYKDVSLWYGITGYLVASGTGFFRMYNNRHWFTDVVAGAAFGILSTKVAYWIYPFIDRNIFNNKEAKTTSMLAPFYNGKETGVSFVMSF